MQLPHTILLHYAFLVFVEGEPGSHSNRNYNERSKRDNGGAFEDFGGPVAQSGRDSDVDLGDIISCEWTPVRAKVLTEIFFGIPDSQVAKMIAQSATCNTPYDCKQICEQLNCNYFAYSVNKQKPVRFYAVSERLIEEGNYVDSDFYDSYFVACKTNEVFDPGCPDCDLVQLFRRFIQKYKKSYKDDKEFQSRFVTFKEGLNSISGLNRNRRSNDEAYFGITQFSDETYESFLAQYTGSLRDQGDERDETPGGSLPNPESGPLIEKCKKWDWADVGVVPPVRNQGMCGCCYAFASSDLLSTQHFIDRQMWNFKTTLSSQYIVDCLSEPEAYGCKGGRPVLVLKRLASAHLPSNYCYPYKNAKQFCQSLPCQNGETLFQPKWSAMFDVHGTHEKRLMANYLHYGPAVVIVDASKAWQFYNGTGVIRGRSCTSKANHAVLLTGYDFSGKQPFYIIKNSWGTEWGNNGYVYLQAGSNACGVAQTVTMTCTLNCDSIKAPTDLLCMPNSFGCITSEDLPVECKNTTSASAKKASLSDQKFENRVTNGFKTSV